MAHGGRKIGVMVPVAEQMNEAKHHKDYECAKSTYASPYSGDRKREAGRELADMDMIVMHCMGYTSEMRRVVSQSSGCPVVLSRDVVAAGLDQLTLPMPDI